MASWWMMLYGSPSPKRLMAKSNWKGIHGLNIGKLSAKMRKEQTKIKTTRPDLIKSVHSACMIMHALYFSKQ